MNAGSKHVIVMLIVLIGLTILPGCTNWKKKYQNLEVESKNLEGRMTYEQGEKGKLNEQLSQSQQTIDELNKKINEMKQNAGEVTGFGKDANVKFDPLAGTITVTVQNDILFNSGEAKLKSKTNSTLDHIYSVLDSKYKGKHIDVIGYTDSDPIQKSKWADNLSFLQNGL